MTLSHFNMIGVLPSRAQHVLFYIIPPAPLTQTVLMCYIRSIGSPLLTRAVYIYVCICIAYLIDNCKADVDTSTCGYAIDEGIPYATDVCYGISGLGGMYRCASTSSVWYTTWSNINCTGETISDNSWVENVEEFNCNYGDVNKCVVGATTYVGDFDRDGAGFCDVDEDVIAEIGVTTTINDYNIHIAAYAAGICVDGTMYQCNDTSVFLLEFENDDCTGDYTLAKQNDTLIDFVSDECSYFDDTIVAVKTFCYSVNETASDSDSEESGSSRDYYNGLDLFGCIIFSMFVTFW